jgi:hypothetical protein
MAPAPLGELGWQGQISYDDPEVAALREQLQAEAGIPGVELVDPAEEGFAERAASIFRRDGCESTTTAAPAAAAAPPPAAAPAAAAAAAAPHTHTGVHRCSPNPPVRPVVLVKDVLNEERLSRIRAGCEVVIREIVGADPDMTSNRGSHRYSFGDTPAFYGQHDAWSALIEPPILHAVLRAIWGSNDFVCRGGAHSAGDFVLPVSWRT